MAVDQFLKLGDIEGESSDKSHGKEIDVLAWSWGMSQAGDTHGGTGGGAGKASIQDLSFTKYFDKASPVIMGACVTGKHIPKAELTIRKAGESPLEYIIITLENILITSVSTGGSQGEDKLTENVTLNFNKYEVSYQAQNKSGGKEGGPVKSSYDIVANS